MTEKQDLVEVAAQSIWEAWRLSEIAPDAYREVSWSVLEAARRNYPDAKSPKAMMDTARDEARAALGSIGIPIDVLQALAEGRMVAMPVEMVQFDAPPSGLLIPAPDTPPSPMRASRPQGGDPEQQDNGDAA
jgi:hypothetical protein